MLEVVIIMLLLFNMALTLHAYMKICDYLLKSKGMVGSERHDDQIEPQNRASSKAVVKNAKLADLPPEIIAPIILKPPKPAGGFGSKVTDK